MIEITEKPLSPEAIVNRVRNEASGCVATYVGLIRNTSHGKEVASVEYRDPEAGGTAALEAIAGEIRQKWPVQDVAIAHRTGVLKVGEINLVVAIAAAHRGEGFAACQYAVDQFKLRLPTLKKETYRDGSVLVYDPKEGG